MSNDNTPDVNRQAGVPLPGDHTETGEVAHGDRRDVHYEPSADHLVTARFTEHPDAPLAPQLAEPRTYDGPAEEGSPIEDVAVAPPGPSVWDARPADDRDGEPPQP